MAHNVKCTVCGQIFDRDKVAAVHTSARRYAHKSCVKEPQLPQDNDYDELIKYIKELFKTNTISAKIIRQIRSYRRDYNYTYSGIQKSLEWFYEKQGNTLENSNYGIGIVPYVYEQARDYYYQLFTAKNTNENVDIKDIVSRNKEIEIEIPQIREKKVHLFNIDIEENLYEQ